MLDLLPDPSPQRSALRARLAELSSPALAAASPPPVAAAEPAKKRGLAGILSLLGVALWKFKALVLLVLSKGKLLLFGLTKAKTVLSMLLALGAYWTVWGWQFALGFVLSIYVHEMGHVIALRRLGIPASAPMFIPFVGAFVRLHKGPETPHDDAVVGLAGPIYGMAAAAVCYGLYLLTGVSLLGALARSGAWINLFNLIPLWQLDGGRAFNALTRQERWAMVAVLGAAWVVSHESMLLLVILAAVFRAFSKQAPERPDRNVAYTYALLVAVLASMTRIALPEIGVHPPDLAF
jgi:Zn-dependent protease